MTKVLLGPVRLGATAMTRRREYLLFFGLMVVCVIVSVCAALIYHVVYQPEVDPYTVDRAKLRMLGSALIEYGSDYGNLPPEGQFRTLLLERDIAADESLFSTTEASIPFRYCTRGGHFVLVGPGANGTYDTPEGYDDIEASQNRGDDIVMWGSLPWKDRENAGIEQERGD